MREILQTGFDKMGIPWDDEKIQRLEKYAELLIEWNKKMNLTAITDTRGIAVKHFLDSAAALTTGKIKGRVIDVGTGAGFPGVVLKIMNPEIELTLLDSLNKRLVFLKEVLDNLGINDVELIHSRAEDTAHKKGYRESYDVATSRAVAALPLLSELCLGYVKPGGSLIALKGPSVTEEAADAKRAIYILGGEIEKIEDANVPGSDMEHKIIHIKKVRHTPIKFPRKSALITKSPIETCYKK